MHAFLGKVLNLLKDSWFSDSYFSNGAGLQYKNYKNFANLCHHVSDFQLAAEWKFFATLHGKSPCDGIGGVIKCLVANASLQSLKESICTPEKMFLWCKNNIKGIRFLYVSPDTEKYVSELILEKRFESRSTVSGTGSYHMYVPTSVSTLEMQRVSFDVISITHENQVKKII